MGMVENELPNGMNNQAYSLTSLPLSLHRSTPLYCNFDFHVATAATLKATTAS